MLGLSWTDTAKAQTLYVVEEPNGVVTFTTRRPGAGKSFRIYSPQKARFSKMVSRRGKHPILGREYYGAIKRFADAQSLEPALVKAVVHVESAFNPAATSHKGAMGLMQLMPDTARRYGVKNAYDANSNLKAGVRHLKLLLTRYDGDVTLALAAYNAGAGAVDKYSTVPPYKETVEYVKRVKRALEVYRCVDAGSSRCG
jgi:soluble lytic murein transglycosylase-like protein